MRAATAARWPVAIGQAAERAGVSARMVRHYEGLGLLAGVARTDSGYRQYTEADVHSLRFIRRARDLGFSMDEIAQLLGLWQDKARASSQVKQIAQKHIDNLLNALPRCRPCSAACRRWWVAATATSGRIAPSWMTWRPTEHGVPQRTQENLVKMA